VKRGGNWSWKWFAINAVSWLGLLWLVVEAGTHFDLEVLATLRSYKWKGFLALVLASLALAPGTYFVVRVLNGAVRRKLEELARNEQKINQNCRLISDEKKLHEIQVKIASEANEFLFATGSRSRDDVYLKKIEARLRAVETLNYTRILFGDIRRDELTHHCEVLSSDPSLSSRARICEIADLSKHTEAFFVLNEKEAVVIIPSLNAIGKFDTALVMKGPYHKRVRSIVESYSRAATTWKPKAGGTNGPTN